MGTTGAPKQQQNGAQGMNGPEQAVFLEANPH